MKICIIGTSHASCLYPAWQKISDNYPDTSISFFFTGGGYFGKFEADATHNILKINDDVIRERFVQLSGGNGDIDLKNFDACVIVGGFFYLPIGRAAALGDEANICYSQQVKKLAVVDLFSLIHAKGLVSKIRDVSDIPIFLIHDPFQTQKPGQPPKGVEDSFEHYDYEKGVALLNQAALFPLGARLLLQPSETIETPYFSKQALALGKRRATQAELDAGHVGEFVEDNHHLNVAYGELRLNKLVAEVQERRHDTRPQL